MIQQFRMGRAVASRTPVVRRPHQALSEMMLPDPVHQDPTCEGIVRRDHSPSQTQPAGSFGKRFCIRPTQRGKESRHHRLAPGQWVAPLEHMECRRGRRLGDHHGARRRSRRIEVQIVDGSAPTAQSVIDGAVQEFQRHRLRHRGWSVPTVKMAAQLPQDRAIDLELATVFVRDDFRSICSLG